MNDQIEVPVLSKRAGKRKAAAEHNAKRLANEVVENRTPTAEERVELEALSKEVFNSTSRYLTLMTRGETVPVTETVTEYVPDEAGGEGVTREVQVPVYLNQNKKSVALKHIRHTVESVREKMLLRKAQIDAFKEAMAKLQAEQKAAQDKAKLTEKVADHLNGSAI